MSNAPYRMDGPKNILTDRLLFWPNNPRLKISDFEEVQYSDEELLDLQNQQKIFNLLRQHEHGVDMLVQSMLKDGFWRECAPLVLEIKNKGKYLVLDGNRRLTAIKVLLSNKHDLSQRVYDSLTSIPCWLFIHTSPEIPLKAAISRLIAQHHIKGQKPHTPIQRAHMIYEAYIGFLLESNIKSFIKHPDIIRYCSDFFGLGEDEITMELAIVRFYKQLVGAGYEVQHHFRERLTWIYKNPKHFKNNFGYDDDEFQLDNPGLERYYDIFIREGCAVHSPTLFKKFLNVMRYGKQSHIEVLRHDSDQLPILEQEVQDKRLDKRFYLELERIDKKLRGLKLSEYRNTMEEDRLIVRISHLVDSILKKLVEMDEGEEKRAEARAREIARKREEIRERAREGENTGAKAREIARRREEARERAGAGAKAREITRKREEARKVMPLARAGLDLKLQGRLTSVDPINYPRFKKIYYYKDYRLTNVQPGDTIDILLRSTEFSTDLFVINMKNYGLLFEDDNEAPTSFISFTAEEGVNYIIRVSSNNERGTGSFELSIQKSSNSKLPQSTNSIEPGATINSQLTSEDPKDPQYQEIYYKRDYRLTNVQPGDSIGILIVSNDFRPDLFVLNMDNDEVLFEDVDDEEDSVVSFTVKEEIDYIVRVTTNQEERTGSFVLRVLDLS